MASTIAGIVALAAFAAASAVAADATYLATIAVNADSGNVRYEMALGPSAARERDRGGQATTADEVSEGAGGIAASGLLRVTADGAPCVAQPPRASGMPLVTAQPRMAIEFQCASAMRTLSIRYDLFEALGSAHQTLALVVWTGGTQQFRFTPESRLLQLDLSTGTIADARGNGFSAGLERLLSDWQLLLFVLCMLLVPLRGTQALAVFATLVAAHAIAITIRVAGLPAPPAALLDAALALSIMLAALWSLLPVVRARVGRIPAVAAGGLLFGVELAAGLATVDWSPAYFVGIESGLALFMVLALPLQRWMHRNGWSAAAVTTICWLALAIAALRLLAPVAA